MSLVKKFLEEHFRKGREHAAREARRIERVAQVNTEMIYRNANARASLKAASKGTLESIADVTEEIKEVTNGSVESTE